MDAYDWLGLAGVNLDRRREPVVRRSSAEPAAIVAVSIDSASAEFAVEERQRAPFPNEIERLGRRRDELSALGQPLLVVPFVPESLAPTLTMAGWSWADSQGNFDLRAPGLVLKQRRTTVAQKQRARHLPRGSGSFAIIRALIRLPAGDEREASATALAGQANVSQPRASQVLARLSELDLVHKASQGGWRPDREALLDRFLAEYEGPGGSERYLYSLDPVTEVAVQASHLHDDDHLVVVSADVGADLVVGWRRPTDLVLYAGGDVSASQLGAVVAQGSHDANVIIRHPTDRSVFPVPSFAGAIGDSDVYMADPTQMIWDLQDLGGADRLEVAGRLREWLLSRH